MAEAILNEDVEASGYYISECRIFNIDVKLAVFHGQTPLSRGGGTRPGQNQVVLDHLPCDLQLAVGRGRLLCFSRKESVASSAARRFARATA